MGKIYCFNHAENSVCQNPTVQGSWFEKIDNIYSCKDHKLYYRGIKTEIHSVLHSLSYEP